MEKYKWDLTRIFKNNNEFKETIKEVNKLLDKIIKYQGKILDNDSSLLELLELDEKIELLTERVYVYAHLGYYDNMGNVTFQSLKEESLNLINKVSSITSFITPELLSSSYDTVKKFISKNKKLEKYSLSLERTFRYKDHVLSFKEEKLLSNMSEILRTPESAFESINNIDIKLGKIKDENGKSIELTNSNYSSLLMSKDKSVRRNAFKKMYKYFENHINTISSLYIGNVKNDVFLSKTRKYKSSLDMELFPDNISEELYNNLIKTTDKNIKYLQDYYKLKSKSLGYKMHMYDLYVNSSVCQVKK